MKYYSLLTMVFGLLIVSNASCMEKRKRGLRSVQSLSDLYMKGTHINELIGSIHTTSLREQLERTTPDAGRWLIEHGVHVPHMQGNNELEAMLKELYPNALAQAILFDRTEKQATQELARIMYEGWGIDNDELAKIAREAFLLAIAQHANDTLKQIHELLLPSLSSEALEEGLMRAAEVGNSEAFDFLLNKYSGLASKNFLSQALKMAVIQRRTTIVNAILLYEITHGISIDLGPALESLDSILATLTQRDQRDAYRNLLENLEIARLGRIEDFARIHSLSNIQNLIQQLRDILSEESLKKH